MPAPLLLLGGTAAQAEDLCPALDRILRSAHEPAPFASLQQAAARGEVLVPGFDPESCRGSVGREVNCWRNLAPTQLDRSAIVPATQQCLRVAPERRSEPFDGVTRFVIRGVVSKPGASAILVAARAGSPASG